MPINEDSEEVLRFWFSSLPHNDHAAMVRQMEWWFRGGADSEIVERFPPLLERAVRGELDIWSHNPRSRLALIIVLDQFSRTIHRGTAQAFAQDPKARSRPRRDRSRSLRGTRNTVGENLLFLTSRTFRESCESGTRGQTRRGTCERGSTRISRHPRVLRKSGARPLRHHRTLRPPSAPQ